MHSAKQWILLLHSSTHILLMLPYSDQASLQSIFVYMSILYLSSTDEAVLFVSAGNWAKCYFYSSRAADHDLRSKPLQHVHPGWVSSTLFIVLHSGYCYSYRHIMNTCGTKLMCIFVDIIIMPFRQENKWTKQLSVSHVTSTSSWNGHGSTHKISQVSLSGKSADSRIKHDCNGVLRCSLNHLKFIGLGVLSSKTAMRRFAENNIR